MGLIDRGAAALGVDGGLVDDIREAAGDVLDLFGGGDAPKAEEPLSDAPGTGLTAYQSSDRIIVPGVLALRSMAGKLSHVIILGRAVPVLLAGAAAAVVFWQRKKITKMLGLRAKKTRNIVLIALAGALALAYYRARKA